jgi:hypothetical protein
MSPDWVHKRKIATLNTSEQSSAFNHEYGSWASEPKARPQPNEFRRLQIFAKYRGRQQFSSFFKPLPIFRLKTRFLFQLFSLFFGSFYWRYFNAKLNVCTVFIEAVNNVYLSLSRLWTKCFWIKIQIKQLLDKKKNVLFIK